MKTHFFMILAGGAPELEFQGELFMRSLERFGNIDYCLTICKNKNDVIKSSYLKQKAEVIINENEDKFNPSWYGGLTCVPSKGDITIYTDADMLITNNLRYIAQNCHFQKAICGVLAYGSPFHNQTTRQIPSAKKIPWTKDDWEKLFNSCDVKIPKKFYTPIQSHYKLKYHSYSCPYYVNLGFVAIPTKHIPAINKSMFRFLTSSSEFYPNHYHRPQFAMCLSIEHLNLPKIALPLWCNCPDNHILLNTMHGIRVIHLFETKSKVNNWQKLNDYIPKINSKFLKETLSILYNEFTNDLSELPK